MIIAIVILILTTAALLLRLRVLSFTVKKQQEYIDEMEEFFIVVQNNTDDTYRKILQIDHMGYFKNNDHTGLVFDGLKNQVELLHNFIITQSQKEVQEQDEEI